MSLALGNILSQAPKKKRTRAEILALTPDKVYNDGRTKQSFRDETDIQKIMARFDQSGTISHLAKFEGVYADYSDFNFHEQTTRLAEGNEIFASLPSELRREFGQSPQKFFDYVNDPKNVDELKKKLPALAKPGQQLPQTSSPDADTAAALAAASTPAATAETSPNPPEEA